jgi:hypothetical protein
MIGLADNLLNGLVAACFGEDADKGNSSSTASSTTVAKLSAKGAHAGRVSKCKTPITAASSKKQNAITRLIYKHPFYHAKKQY